MFADGLFIRWFVCCVGGCARVLGFEVLVFMIGFRFDWFLLFARGFGCVFGGYCSVYLLVVIAFYVLFWLFAFAFWWGLLVMFWFNLVVCH